ncbi:hypothetical protein TNCT_592702 [Trichonephila clavata]|uniref:Uncharacterized protein n=1 Tax=Trichonephila clavata TaxID=2740835 RepID=A0A8X6IVW3_TRICU|nr:hypothetical protein TNCT_592702 [Trichonephila clavata]
MFHSQSNDSFQSNRHEEATAHGRLLGPLLASAHLGDLGLLSVVLPQPLPQASGNHSDSPGCCAGQDSRGFFQPREVREGVSRSRPNQKDPRVPGVASWIHADDNPSKIRSCALSLDEAKARLLRRSSLA